MIKNNVFLAIYMILILIYNEAIIIGSITHSKVLFLFSVFLFSYLIYKRKENLIQKIEEKTFLKKYFLILILFFVVVLISFVLSILAGGGFYFTNVFEVFRIILYMIILANFLMLIEGEENYLFLKKFMLLLLVINSVVAITQFFNLFNMNELYIKIIAPTQYVTLVNNYPYPRAVGLTANPNVFAFVLALAIVFVFADILKKPFNKKNYILTVLFHIVLYMTSSRTGFIITIVGELIVAFLFYFESNKHKIVKTFKVLLIILLVEIGVLFVMPDHLTWRLKVLVTFGKINSWEERNDIRSDFWTSYKLEMEEIDKSSQTDSKSKFLNPKIYKKIKIFIGNGPDKKFFSEKLNYDNEYILVFVRYGSVGILLFLLLFLYPLLAVKTYSKEQKSLFYALAGMSLLYMYPAGFFHSYRLYPLLLVLFILNDYKIKIPRKQFSSHKKNILIIAPVFPPQGGIGTFRVTKFAKFLSKNNYDISVITPSQLEHQNMDKSLLRDIPENVKMYKLNFKSSYKKFPSLDFYFAAKKALPNIIKETNPSVVFITGGPFYILPIGRYIYEKFEIPYIIDFRDPWILNYDDKSASVKTKLKIKIDKVMEKYTVNKASAIISVNDVMTKFYKSKYPKIKKRFHTITNGYDIEDFQLINPEKFEKFTILYTGKFEVSAGFRNPELLFKAIDKLNANDYEIEFMHIGEREEKICEMLNKHKFNSILPGFLPYSKVLKYCKGANLLVVISGNRSLEQTGKIFDYLGCEKPVLAITNKSNELYKVCKDFKHIEVVDPKSISEIENAIKKVYNSSSQRIKIAKDNKYSREQLTAKLINIIENIVKGG